MPANRYWGAQTPRGLIHFSIGDDRMPKRVYHALKEAALASGDINEKAFDEIGDPCLLAGGLARSGMSRLRPLLLLQPKFLVAFLVLCVTAGLWSSADALLAIIAGMFGVAAQISLKNSPTTAVMT